MGSIYSMECKTRISYFIDALNAVMWFHQYNVPFGWLKTEIYLSAIPGGCVKGTSPIPICLFMEE